MTATKNVSASKNLLFIICFSCFTGSLNAQNYLLSFDGSNVVNAGNDALLNTSNSVKGMECWVKFDVLDTRNQEIISKSTQWRGMELVYYDNQISFFVMFDGENGSSVGYDASNLVTDTWYHVAGTWDGATKESIRLYINGVSVGTRTDIGDINLTGVANVGDLLIGNWSTPPPLDRFLMGDVDEVRIWGTDRTAEEVKKGMYGTVATDDPGLIAYYTCNDGSGSLLTNSTPNAGLDGTLTAPPAWEPSPIQSGNNAIQLNGSDNYLVAPPNPAYDFATGTVEFMMNPSFLDASNDLIIATRQSGSTRFSIHASNTGIGFYNGSEYNTVPYAFNVDEWYHVAFVFGPSSTTIYINGEAQESIPSTLGVGTNLQLAIGKLPVAPAGTETFTGTLDEVRLWNTQRSATEINDFKDLTITGSEAGLVGLYSFDQGIPGGANSGLNIVIDKSPTNNHLVLGDGYTLSGGTSNYVSSIVTEVLPVRMVSFTVTQNVKGAVLNWTTATEENSDKFIIQRSENARDYTAIGTVMAAGTTGAPQHYTFIDLAPLDGKNYYRLKQVDRDNRFMYTQVRLIDFRAIENRLYWFSAGEKTVEVRLKNGNNEAYQLADMGGRVIERGRLQSGRKLFTNLHSGIYVLTLAEKERGAIRFVVK